MLLWITYAVKKIRQPLLIALLCVPSLVWTQQRPALSLQEAFTLAEHNYPLLQQKSLLRQSDALSIQNIATGYLPQLSFYGQATYQSEVTRVDIPLPGLKLPTPGKDQYRAMAEVNQLLYDGGLISNQKIIQSLTTRVEENKVEVERYNLKTRVNQIYFGILLQDQLLKQSTLLLGDLQAGIDKVRPLVENGVTLRSSLQVLQAQQLQARQKVVEIEATKKGLLDALSVYLGQLISASTQLEAPFSHDNKDTAITRPELEVFRSQASLLAAQSKLIRSRNLPKASAFLQGGYGRPGLNLLSDQFNTYYVSGIRLNWSLGGLYTTRRELQQIDINRKTVNRQQETFLLNTRSQLQQQKAEIEKYAALVALDKEIIDVRQKITESAKAQLENAVITSNDYIVQVNAEDAARQGLILHQLQWLQAKVNYAILSGKM